MPLCTDESDHIALDSKEDPDTREHSDRASVMEPAGGARNRLRDCLGTAGEHPFDPFAQRRPDFWIRDRLHKRGFKPFFPADVEHLGKG